MAKHLPFVFLMSIFIVFLVMFRVVSSSTDQTISSYCSQTPYPTVCDSFISSTTKNPQVASLDEAQTGFRDLALTVTMSQAKRAHQLVLAMDLSSFDERANAAWADCLELLDDTISQLNRSMRSTDSTVMNDAQTWLSATIMNQRTCQDGFIELNSSSYLASFDPFMFGNFSKLLSNSLAINKAMISTKTEGAKRRLLADRFPTWVSPADRKLLQSNRVTADLVVAQDGSGNYKTITEAVAAAGKLSSGSKRFVIHVKAGTYKENVVVTKKMKNLMIIGDGIDATIVTGNRNVQDGSTTFRSATFAVSGDGFIAKGITFENTAGPQKHQAVALRSGSDLSVFYSCSFKGYQDTLYVYSQRQFYRNCDIYGTIDFIFGDAAAVLQNCNIYVRKPMSGQWNTLTAQGRTDPNENTGISVHNSQVTAASDLKAVQGSFKTYLGRPWQKYSRTVFMKTNIDSLINPVGWLAWSGNFALNTLYYGEYMNTGGGAGTGGRVKWPGFHVMSAAEATKFTVGDFLGGSSWIPATGVPYTTGL